MTARATPPDRLVGAAFALAAALTPLAAILSHRAIAPLVALMAIAVSLRPEIWRDGFALLSPARLVRDPFAIAAAATLALAIWTATTAFWSPTLGAEWLGLTLLAGALCAGALAYEANRAPPRRAAALAVGFAISVSAGAVLLLFEGLSGGYLRDVTPPADLTPFRWKDTVALGRGVTAIAPLVFPAAVIIRRVTGSWIVAGLPVLGLLIASTQFSIFANTAGLIAGAGAFLFALARPRLGIKLVAAMFAITLAAAPFAALALPADAVLDGSLSILPPSWAQRIVAWRFAGAEALQHCFPLGCGADYARALAESGGTIQIPNWPLAVQSMPTHPHNLFLQIWLELGAPGVILTAAALMASGGALLRARLARLPAAAICAAATACLISVMFEASIWQAWRLGVFALAACGGAVSNAAEIFWSKKGAC